MAGMRVVGRVAVKVWPDVSEFRKRAKVALEKASKGLKVEVPLEVDDDQAKLELRRATLMLNRTARSNPLPARRANATGHRPDRRLLPLRQGADG